MSNKNIYLFYGEDTYSIWQKMNRWKEEFIKKHGELNLHEFDGQNATAKEILEAVHSASFLSEKKLVIVRGFLEGGDDDEQKKFSEKIENLDNDTILLCVEYGKPDARMTLFKKIKKLGKLEEFVLPIGPKLTQWINQKVTEMGGTIGNKESAHLAETVGPNLWQMEQEIKKLLLYCKEKKITITAIDEVVSPNVSASVFKLTDYLGQKKTAESLRTLDQLLKSGEDLMKTFFMMVRQFRLLVQARSCLDERLSPKEIAATMKEHPFVISNVTQQAKNFPMDQLKKIYGTLLEIDSRIKNGKIKITTGDQTELRLALEKFMIEISN